MIRLLPLLAPVLLVAGCAREGGSFPSLAPRPAEKLGFDEPAARPAPTATPDPALDARLAGMDQQLGTITKGFAADAAVAERAATAARGRPAGSEEWLNAQVALAQLDDWRSQASSLVTDLEAIATERAAALAPTYPALTALSARADAEAQREGQVIGKLQSGLPQG